MRTCLILTVVLFFTGQLYAQSPVLTKAELDSIYQVNIKLSKINGVYIPANITEAFLRLETLTPKDALDNFKNAEEKTVCKKLHFGIGRWMIINWNFYEGSRLSHYLKEKGLLHPDDMAQFLLRTFHRHLNGNDLEQKRIVDELAEARKKHAQELINN
ncbi:MAG: hypothetical protein HKN09_11485 [Saprospiraceae bacterium]|nr:hypothetical protein [Saprospiraceae bacterium]